MRSGGLEKVEMEEGKGHYLCDGAPSTPDSAGRVPRCVIAWRCVIKHLGMPYKPFSRKRLRKVSTRLVMGVEIWKRGFCFFTHPLISHYLITESDIEANELSF